MTTRFALAGRLAAAVAAVALVVGSGTAARADFAYGFATQNISGLTITPAKFVTGAVSTFTQDGSTVNGAGLANSDPMDAIQAYQGGAPASAQNFFARYAPGNPPVSPVGNFTRGDAAIISLAGPANSTSVVAESYLNTVAGMNETGSGGLGASLTLTLSTSTTLAIAYSYDSRLFVSTTGGGNATASYNFGVSIKDAAGNVVFSSNTANTNLTLSAPPPGGEIIRTGTETVTTGSLIAGQTYSLSFSSTAQSSVSVVPEPASMALLAIGVVGILAVNLRRGVKA